MKRQSRSLRRPRIPPRRTLSFDAPEVRLHRDEFFRAWAELAPERKAFAEAFDADSNLPAWTYDPETRHVQQGTGARDAARGVLYRDWEYTNDLQPNEARQLIGVVGASETTLKHTTRLNQVKEAFALAWRALTPYEVPVAGGDPVAFVRQALGAIHESMRRYNYRSCTREIVVLEGSLVRVSFSSRRADSVCPVTREQALRALDQPVERSAVREVIRTQLQQLPDNVKIAQRIDGSEIFVANVKYATALPGRDTLWKQFSSGQPMLLRLQPGETLPLIIPPRSRAGERKPRKKRNDCKLEPIPFVPSLHLYRYIDAATNGPENEPLPPGSSDKKPATE